MSAVLEALALPSPASGHRLLVHSDWEGYQRFLSARGESLPSLRITYNRGRLELTTVSNEHERFKKLLPRVIELISFATGGEIVSSGQVTISRADLDRGFEPDECYYIRNAARVREVRNLDFERDPPPDLAVEIEISRGLADRIDIYAAVGVPEVWCFDGTNLRVLILLPDRTYAEQTQSLAFPRLDMTVVARVLHDAGTAGENAALRQLHAWVRQNLLPPPGQDVSAGP
jgi:Uma2 family endonuclease